MSCHLLEDSFAKLLRFSTQAWQEDLLTLYSASTQLRGLPDVSRTDTVAVVRTFPKKDRRALLREISGAFLIGPQKAHISSDASSSCEFCQLRDGKEHRILECPAFSEARQPFQDILNRLVDEGSSLLYFPVVHVHRDFYVHQALHYQESPLTICPAAIQLANAKLDAGITPVFYTDGSCLYPQHPSSRYAAAAIVFDL